MTPTEVPALTPADALFDSPELAGPAVVESAHALLAGFEPLAAFWPRTEDMLVEIEMATEVHHGGPMTVPELASPRTATWDEVRARLAAEKTGEA